MKLCTTQQKTRKGETIVWLPKDSSRQVVRRGGGRKARSLCDIGVKTATEHVTVCMTPQGGKP